MKRLVLFSLIACCSMVTAQERAARQQKIDVQSYLIDAQVDPRAQTLTATAMVRFIPLEDTSSVTFELNNALNISRAETLGVISFYHDFHRAPVDGRVLKLCRAESCQSMGCEQLVSHLALRHGIKVDDEDNHSALHVETVFCLGNCALSPAALLDGAPIGRLDRDRIDAIVAGAQGKTH